MSWCSPRPTRVRAAGHRLERADRHRPQPPTRSPAKGSKPGGAWMPGADLSHDGGPPPRVHARRSLCRRRLSRLGLRGSCETPKGPGDATPGGGKRGRCDADDVRRDARSAGVAADCGSGGVLGVLRGDLCDPARPVVRAASSEPGAAEQLGLFLRTGLLGPLLAELGSDQPERYAATSSQPSWQASHSPNTSSASSRWPQPLRSQVARWVEPALQRYLTGEL